MERGREITLGLWPIGYYHSKILMVILEPKQQHRELVLKASGQLRVFLLDLAFTQKKIFCWPTSSSFLTSPFPSSIGPRQRSLREFYRSINYFLARFGCRSFWSASFHAKAKRVYDKMFRSGCWVTELWNRKPEATIRRQEKWSCNAYLQLLKIIKFTTEWRALEVQQLPFPDLMRGDLRTAVSGRGD